MAEQHNPTVYKLQLGATLEAIRLRAVVERDDVAKVIGCSVSKIGRIERGDVSVSPQDLRALLDHFEVPSDERAEIEQLSREARKRRPRTPYGSVIPDKFRKFFHLEETASEIQSYDGELVHGLAQTEAYARAVTVATPLHRPMDVDRLIQARMARQQRLTSAEPPRLWLVLSEGAIRRVVGGPEVMREQLGKLVELSQLAHVTIQVVPFDRGAHAATGLPFIILTRPMAQRLVYLENVTDAQFVDDPDRVAAYELVFRHVLTSALSPAESVTMIDSVAEEL
jgi:transcriptional regulator with XRE-family HTH domain